MSTGDCRIVITIDAAGQVEKVQDFERALKDLEGQTGKVGAGIRSFGDEFASRLIPSFTLATLAADAVKKAFGGMKDFALECIKGAMDEEASENRLTTALELTGRARGGAIASMMKFAQEQAKLTTYSHEQIEATETLLVQMTGQSPRAIMEMTKGVMGLAAVLGPNEGLEGATSRVVRAIEGNAQGLARVGIEIDTTLPKGQQLIQIQQRLSELYPRATAELDTMGGKVRQVGKTWQEFKETLGRVITEDQAVSDTLKFFGSSLDSVNEKVEKARDEIRANKDAAIEWRATLIYVKPTIEEMGKAFAKGDTDWENYKKRIGETDKQLQAFRPTMDAAVDAFNKFFGVTEKARLPLLKFAADTYDAQRAAKKFEEQWEQWDIVEVSASSAFQDAENKVEDLDNIFKDLGITLGSTAPDWDLLYQNMEKNKSYIDTLASSMISFGGTNKTVMDAIGGAWGGLTKTILENLEKQVLAQELATIKVITLEKQESLAAYISGIFKSFGFWGLPLAIVAFGVINALFSKVLKFEQGGVFKQPTLAMVGHGTEYVLPERKLITIVQQAQRTAPGTTSNSVINGGIHIHVSGAVDAEAIWTNMEKAARRRGIRIGRG